MKTHLGCTYRCAQGKSHSNWQLLNDRGCAVAIADFTDGKITRFDSIDSIRQEAEVWVKQLEGKVAL